MTRPAGEQIRYQTVACFTDVEARGYSSVAAFGWQTISLHHRRAECCVGRPRCRVGMAQAETWSAGCDGNVLGGPEVQRMMLLALDIAATVGMAWLGKGSASA